MTSRYYCGTLTLEPRAEVHLPDEETHHLVKVMRGRVGDQILVFGDSGLFAAVVTGLGGKGSGAAVLVGQPVTNPAPPSVRLIAVVPWIKGGKTDFVVQKLTEIGVSGITIFQAEREVARGDELKLDRLRKVALEACKQSERVDVPQLGYATSLLAAIRSCDNVPLKNRLILHERTEALLFSSAVREALVFSHNLMFASGPEGGWHPAELDSVEGISTCVSLGPRILRAETAPVVAAAAALAVAGDI